ncbi:MAG TPA: LLM class flavin-dependent oxidoreductase [Acidobacteriota bacterium]|jgi:alkanesulfonate monooxygenase
MEYKKYDPPVDVFSTAPQSADATPEAYIQKVVNVARWSEEAGCKGILIYTDNRLVDPWLVAQIVIQSTQSLRPLVAIQPIYMHPYSVAKMVSSLAFMYERQIYLNMVAGGFCNDLLALCDETPHDMRYERLREYTTIIKELLSNRSAVTFSGKFYRVENLHLKPALPPHLLPGIFISGSSEAGMATARALGATAIEYPRSGEEYAAREAGDHTNSGIRIGIIAAEDETTAWQLAHERFPPDRKGQITHMMAMKASDSLWHKQLSELDQEIQGQETCYWLWPFKNYKTFCPYLVGSYKKVSEELAKYIKAGFKNFILDIPAEKRDLQTAGIVFTKAVEESSQWQSYCRTS